MEIHSKKVNVPCNSILYRASRVYLTVDCASEFLYAHIIF